MFCIHYSPSTCRSVYRDRRDAESGEGRINRFLRDFLPTLMLEKFEHRSYIGRLVYSWIELVSKLSVRISFYENLSLSLSLSLRGLTADRLLLF